MATRSSCRRRSGSSSPATSATRAPTTIEPNLTVLQAISLAGGLTDRGSNRGVQIIRNKKEFDAKLTDIVQANDTIVVRQRRM